MNALLCLFTEACSVYKRHPRAALQRQIETQFNRCAKTLRIQMELEEEAERLLAAKCAQE
jgi:predicted nuclease with RNAse H fold